MRFTILTLTAVLMFSTAWAQCPAVKTEKKCCCEAVKPATCTVAKPADCAVKPADCTAVKATDAAKCPCEATVKSVKKAD